MNKQNIKVLNGYILIEELPSFTQISVYNKKGLLGTFYLDEV